MHLIRHRGRVVILTYCRVVSDEMVRDECIQSGMYVKRQSFEAHVTYLRKRFDIISMNDLLDLWPTDRLRSDRAYCVITFDDGWKDNYKFAFPVPMKYGIPATIFLATDFIGSGRWFWPDQLMLLIERAREHTVGAAKREAVSMVLAETIGITLSVADGSFRSVESGAPIDPDAIVESCKEIEADNVRQLIDRVNHALHMDLPTERILFNWGEVRKMAENGVTFGSHSCSHRIMTQVPLAEVKAELVDSRKALPQQGITPVPVFCYPNGNFDQDIQELVRESGYRAAVGCEVGFEQDRPSDLFALKRIGLHEDSSASVPLLALALSGYRYSQYHSNVEEKVRGAVVMEPKPCVLVTDGQERSALAITRGLGQKDIPVIVGAETVRSLAGASRYCLAQWQYPSPLQHPAEFVSSLVEAVRRFGITAIIPPSDASMQAVAGQRDRFRPSVIRAIPSLESYDLVSDKYRLMKLAQELGIPIPQTVFVPDGNVDAVLGQVMAYPVVVKPGRSLLRVDGSWIKTSVHFVSNSDELADLYRRTPYLRNPSLIQQRVEGEGQGVFGIFDSGRPRALFAHRRIREKPPAGGVSVLRESVGLPQPMTDYAARLLQHVKWHGVAMVEFKSEVGTGTPRLLEINGRFWGSLQLALDAGVNFPYLLYQLARERPIVLQDGGYRVGVKSRWLLGDLDHLLVRMIKSGDVLRLPRRYPSRAKCVFEFMRFFQKDLHYEVERWDDPAPARYELGMYLKAILKGHG